MKNTVTKDYQDYGTLREAIKEDVVQFSKFLTKKGIHNESTGYGGYPTLMIEFGNLDQEVLDILTDKNLNKKRNPNYIKALKDLGITRIGRDSYFGDTLEVEAKLINMIININSEAKNNKKSSEACSLIYKWTNKLIKDHGLSRITADEKEA